MDVNNKESVDSNNELALTESNISNTSLSSLNLLTPSGISAAEVILKRLMKTEKGGVKSVEDGLAIMMRAQDLRLPFTTCIEHIHVINGKTGVDIHIIKSLLSRAGVVWECSKDYTPLYQYTDGNSVYNETLLPEYCIKCKDSKDAELKSVDGKIGVYLLPYYQDLKGNVYTELQISDKCVKAINKAHAIKLANDGKFPVIRIPAQPVDYVTEYKFTRYKMINGKERITTATSHFSYSEAVNADFFKKDTYVKYARILIGHRAFTLGARDIASDVIMGLGETSEIKIVEGVGLNPNDFEYADEIQ